MADLTLALDYDALERLADPAAAVGDARRWSERICFVTDRPAHVLTAFERTHDLEQDYYVDPEPVEASLETIRLHFDTERYVYVGVDEAEATLPHDDWEFRHVDEAADAADWRLDEPDDGGDEPAADPFGGDADWP
ncbi:MAG: hypothetical protein ABEJ61_05080 [Haloferacaceae archaeon]